MRHLIAISIAAVIISPLMAGNSAPTLEEEFERCVGEQAANDHPKAHGSDKCKGFRNGWNYARALLAKANAGDIIEAQEKLDLPNAALPLPQIVLPSDGIGGGQLLHPASPAIPQVNVETLLPNTLSGGLGEAVDIQE